MLTIKSVSYDESSDTISCYTQSGDVAIPYGAALQLTNISGNLPMYVAIVGRANWKSEWIRLKQEATNIGDAESMRAFAMRYKHLFDETIVDTATNLKNIIKRCVDKTGVRLISTGIRISSVANQLVSFVRNGLAALDFTHDDCILYAVHLADGPDLTSASSSSSFVRRYGRVFKFLGRNQHHHKSGYTLLFGEDIDLNNLNVIHCSKYLKRIMYAQFLTNAALLEGGCLQAENGESYRVHSFPVDDATLDGPIMCFRRYANIKRRNDICTFFKPLISNIVYHTSTYHQFIQTHASVQDDNGQHLDEATIPLSDDEDDIEDDDGPDVQDLAVCFVTLAEQTTLARRRLKKNDRVIAMITFQLCFASNKPTVGKITKVRVKLTSKFQTDGQLGMETTTNYDYLCTDADDVSSNTDSSACFTSKFVKPELALKTAIDETATGFNAIGFTRLVEDAHVELVFNGRAPTTGKDTTWELRRMLLSIRAYDSIALLFGTNGGVELFHFGNDRHLANTKLMTCLSKTRRQHSPSIVRNAYFNRNGMVVPICMLRPTTVSLNQAFSFITSNGDFYSETPKLSANTAQKNNAPSFIVSQNWSPMSLSLLPVGWSVFTNSVTGQSFTNDKPSTSTHVYTVDLTVHIELFDTALNAYPDTAMVLSMQWLMSVTEASKIASFIINHYNVYDYELQGDSMPTRLRDAAEMLTRRNVVVICRPSYRQSLLDGVVPTGTPRLTHNLFTWKNRLHCTAVSKLCRSLNFDSYYYDDTKCRLFIVAPKRQYDQDAITHWWCQTLSTTVDNIDNMSPISMMPVTRFVWYALYNDAALTWWLPNNSISDDAVCAFTFCALGTALQTPAGQLAYKCWCGENTQEKDNATSERTMTAIRYYANAALSLATTSTSMSNLDTLLFKLISDKFGPEPLFRSIKLTLNDYVSYAIKRRLRNLTTTNPVINNQNMRINLLRAQRKGGDSVDETNILAPTKLEVFAYGTKRQHPFLEFDSPELVCDTRLAHIAKREWDENIHDAYNVEHTLAASGILEFMTNVLGKSTNSFTNKIGGSRGASFFFYC